jgi:hypothetical protein
VIYRRIVADNVSDWSYCATDVEGDRAVVETIQERPSFGPWSATSHCSCPAFVNYYTRDALVCHHEVLLAGASIIAFAALIKVQIRRAHGYTYGLALQWWPELSAYVVTAIQKDGAVAAYNALVKVSDLYLREICVGDCIHEVNGQAGKERMLTMFNDNNYFVELTITSLVYAVCASEHTQSGVNGYAMF